MDQVVAVTQRSRHTARYSCLCSRTSADHSSGHDIVVPLAATGSASTLQGVPEVVMFAIPDWVANLVVTRSPRVVFA
jgi:hypothetical protein